jgi:hypothetical protein
VKRIAVLPSAAATALFAFALASAAQAPAGPPPGAGPHNAPPPKNLKVLPKDLTGEQVHEIMHKWSADLGVRCTTCHQEDPTRKTPDGKPQLDFAADTKEQKLTARKMFTMMKGINGDYISKIPNADGKPVTCGTCHRGNLDPEPYVAPKHEGPPPGGPPPAAVPPAGQP